MFTRRVVVTSGVLNALPNTADANWLHDCLMSMEIDHNWGSTHPEDWEMNDRAIESKLKDDRVVAKWVNLDRKVEIFIIAEIHEDNKPLTTIMLTEEY